MARIAGVIPTWTPVAVADTVAMTTLGYHNIQGGSSTQRGEVREIYIGGQAGASAPTYFVFGRCSTVTGATLVATRSAALDPSTAALAAPPSFTNSTSGTFPQRSSTLGMLLSLSMNAFGGIVRWTPGTADETISYLGNTASLGELSLNAFTGGTPGAVGSNIVIEVL